MWWEILELTAEADQKAIKLAYAKKLKKTRPDDDPEGFKALHEAYQQALAWHANKDLYAAEDEVWEEDNEATLETSSPVDHSAPESAVPFSELFLSFSAKQTGEQTAPPLQVAYLAESQTLIEQEPLQLHSTTLKAPELNLELNHQTLKAATLTSSDLLKPATPVFEEDQSTTDEEQFAADWRSFQQQFSINIHNETYRKDPTAWHFLEKLPSFIDLEFRDRLSHEMFGFISEANLKAAEHKSLFIKPAVLQYLNQLFAWDQQWRYLTEQFGEQQTDAILTHLELATPNKHIALRVQPEALYYYPRLLAFVIDLAFLFIVVFGLSLILEKPQDLTNFESKVFLGALIWFTIYPLVEASALQASLGKKLMKLKVVNKHGQHLSIAHSYIRHLVTNACIIGFKIVIWINMLLAYKRSMLLQDWLTQSYVIKRD
ncbi:RDD family protein [uncultured Thiothrix sp.]|uniref:RDD family protein n=1 Tax=uncultured Thiothrix sp. TaxID=223185 RepID=UPI002617526F|nr:RDD family protein [uncultured Thiothrix sp.]